MGFDSGRRTLHRYRFDHIRVDGSLGQPVYAFDLTCFRLKNIDEYLSDDLPFLFRIGYSIEGVEEQLRCIYALYIQVHVPVGIEDILKFIFSEKSVIDENAMQVGANGIVQQYPGNGRVDTAG